ncbi:MAG: Icc-related predicted phosphoesterase [Candidatus Nanohaloarchaea archaeon]|jgi:Icc-related predicted phosphoesterase
MSLKMLVTSDYHQKEDLLEATVKEIENGDYDIYVNLGDYMSEDYAEELFNRVDIPALGCTGNRDMMFSNEFLDGEVPVYNFVEADIDEEYLLILIGGDFPDDIKQKVTDLIEDHGDSSKVIIGSHYPPHKIGDRIHSGRRIGFEQFRELIIKEKPALWMNGHVHEDFGERELLGVPVLNAAAEETGKAFSVTIGDEGGVESIEIVDLVE